VWEIYQTAKSFNTRPSDILGVTDKYAAYCLDTAVGEFGRVIENELSGVEGKTKKEIASKSDRLMRKWLDMPQQFRSPMATRAATRELP
jgi:hypothetical protein